MTRASSSLATRIRGSTIDLHVEAAPPLNILRIGYANEVSSGHQVLLVQENPISIDVFY